MIRRWIGTLEPTRPGQPGGDLVYWRGHLADHSRPISHEEFDKLRRRGLRNLRNFYRSLWGVAALLLVSFELYRWSGDAAIYVVLANLGACVLVLYSVATHLLPALQFLRVPHNATVQTFSDPATFTVLADSPIEVVIPGGLALRRAGVEEPVPKVVELGYAATPVPQDVAQLPQESWRDATPGELVELHRRGSDRAFLLFMPIVILVQAGTYLYRSLSDRSAVFLAMGFFLALMALLALSLSRTKRKKPAKMRIVRDAVVGDRVVAWAEFAPGYPQPWTIGGEPADWRKR